MRTRKNVGRPFNTIPPKSCRVFSIVYKETENRDHPGNYYRNIGVSTGQNKGPHLRSDSDEWVTKSPATRSPVFLSLLFLTCDNQSTGHPYLRPLYTAATLAGTTLFTLKS